MTYGLSGIVAGFYYSDPSQGSDAATPAALGVAGAGSAGAQINGGTASDPARAGAGGGAGRIRINTSCDLELGPSSVITPAVGTACYSTGELGAR
jgi:hypothetical protein